MALEFETADVFTDTRFGGNPLAVVHGAGALETAAMQAIAREFNLSETVFVTGVGAGEAQIRIFTPGVEVPFAGHPNVGAAVLLARRHGWRGQVVLHQAAGAVRATLAEDLSSAEITAPRALSLGRALDAAAVAACGCLTAEELRGPARMAGCGLDFAIAEVADAATLARAAPHPAAASVLFGDATGVLFHAPLGDGRRRARMFSPLDGIPEDPATGSANCALAGLLLQESGGAELALEVEQGVEMGRPSRLALRAWREAGAIRVAVGGGVVPVSRGVLHA
ncbi:MAG: PhzF family phenazine biosynthesis protein [Rubritepida sp.]|nr:PhzF family phenazine biosynthesis protein [Rubritepida sp.]